MKKNILLQILETTSSEIKNCSFSEKNISASTLWKSDKYTQYVSKPSGFNKIGHRSSNIFSLFAVFLSFFTSFSQELPTTSANPPTVWGVNNLNLIESNNLGFITHVEDPFGNGVVDNQFTQGSKDFFEAQDLRWVIGQTKAKNDIANGAAILVGTTLFFAGDRTSTNGDAQIGFWFYKNDTGPRTRADGTRDFAPNHVEGDVLVLANFTNGGNTATVSVYIWKASGGNVPNTNGHLQTFSAAGNARLNHSPYAVPQGWQVINPGPSPSYQINQFYEGYVNLADLGDGLCFSTFLLEARSSQSVTASLDDFTGGDFNVSPRVVTTSTEVCDGEIPNNSFNLNNRINTSESTPNLTFTFYENTIVNNTDTPDLTKPITGSKITAFPAPIGTTKIWVLGESNVLTGCTGQASFTIKINQNPQPSVADQIACVGYAAIFSTNDLGNDFSYQWSSAGADIPGATTSSYTTPLVATTDNNKVYTVTVTRKGTTCTESDSGTLTVRPNATAAAGPDQTKCQTGASGPTSFKLAGTATNGTPTWTQVGSTGTANSNIITPGSLTSDVSVSGTGTVTLRLTTLSNFNPPCDPAQEDVILTVNANPAPPDVTYNAPACDETTFSITITNVISGAIYTVRNKTGAVVSGLSPASPYTAPNASNITFSNFPAGAGYQVSVSVTECSSGTTTCPAPSPDKIAAPTSIKEEATNDTEKASFTVFPVPFKDQLTVRYNFDKASQVLIEVFNSQGKKILSKKDTSGSLNKEIQLNLNSKTGQNEVYFVKVTTDKGSSVQKVISSR